MKACPEGYDQHLLTLLFDICLAQFSRFRVETDTNFAPALVQKLLDGAIYLAFVVCPTEMETVLYTFLSRSSLHAVMPGHPPAADKTSASLDDFAKDYWIVFQESAHPVFCRPLMNQTLSMAVSIRELHHMLTPQEVVHMVNSGIGISFATQALARSVHPPGIVCRSLVHDQLVLNAHTAIRTFGQILCTAAVF
jgi:hypothetical protein